MRPLFTFVQFSLCSRFTEEKSTIHIIGFHNLLLLIKIDKLTLTMESMIIFELLLYLDLIKLSHIHEKNPSLQFGEKRVIVGIFRSEILSFG